MSVRAYRDAAPFSAAALQTKVLELAMAESVMSGVELRRARVFTAELLNKGVGLGEPDVELNGYRQVLSLYTALLLRVAGASVEAVRAEVVGRDEARLEVLLDALLLRLAQQQEDENNVRVATGLVEQVDGLQLKDAPRSGAPTTAAESVVHDGGQGALPAAPHASLSWVRAQMTHDVMRFVSRPPPSFVGIAPKPLGRARTSSRPAFALRTEAVSFELAPGMHVELSAAACNQLASAGERENAVEAFRVALDRALRVDS